MRPGRSPGWWLVVAGGLTTATMLYLQAWSRLEPAHRVARQQASDDLWVNGQEVNSFDLPRTFAMLRYSPRWAFLRAHIEAMSADTVRTSNARGRSRISPKTASERLSHESAS